MMITNSLTSLSDYTLKYILKVFITNTLFKNKTK